MCRILIGLSVRLMLVFDVFQGAMAWPNSREKDGEKQRKKPDCWHQDFEGQGAQMGELKVYIFFFEKMYHFVLFTRLLLKHNYILSLSLVKNKVSLLF